MLSNNVELAKPRDFGETISDTFLFIRQNFKPLLKYFFIFSGFFLLASAALSIMLQVKAMALIDNANPNSFASRGPFGNIISLAPAYLLELFLLLMVYITVDLTVICYMALYKQKQNNVPGTEEMWGYMKYYFFKALGSYLLMALLIGLGFLFCLIPGLYLLPIMALVVPIMVVENTSFGYAFNQSFRLIKDNWWQTFGVLVVVYIILYVANLAIAIPTLILGAGNIFLGLGREALSLPVAILVSLLQTLSHILQILMIVAAGLCYFNLSESKEGTALIERINQFGTMKPDSDAAPEEY